MNIAKWSGGAAAAAVVLLWLGACKDSTEPAVACTEPVILSVGSGTSPLFSWEPACLVGRIVVQDSIANDVWEVLADSGNSIASGVRYGSVPARASQTMVAVPLIAGDFYGIGLFIFTGLAPGQGELLAAKGFRP